MCNITVSRSVRDIGYCFGLDWFLCWLKSEQNSYSTGAAGKWRSVQTHHCHWESEQHRVRHTRRFYAKIWFTSKKNTGNKTKKLPNCENPSQQRYVSSLPANAAA